MRWPPSLSLENGSSQSLHQAIVEQAQEAIIFVDREGIIRLWNRGAEVLFGYGSDEVKGHSLDFIVPERYRLAHHRGFQKAIESGQMLHEGRILTTRAQTKYGSRLYVDFSFGLLKDARGASLGAFAIGRDCTTRYVEQAVQQGRAGKLAEDASQSVR